MSNEIKDSEYILYLNTNPVGVYNFYVWDYNEEGKEAANKELKALCMSKFGLGKFMEACNLTVYKIQKGLGTKAIYTKKEFMTMGELKEHDKELMDAFLKANFKNNQERAPRPC